MDRHIKLFICITLYNEDQDTLRKTLMGVADVGSQCFIRKQPTRHESYLRWWGNILLGLASEGYHKWHSAKTVRHVGFMVLHLPGALREFGP